MTLGGILGTVIPLIAAAANSLTVHADGKVLIIMSVGGLLCAVFAGLLYKVRVLMALTNLAFRYEF